MVVAAKWCTVLFSHGHPFWNPVAHSRVGVVLLVEAGTFVNSFVGYQGSEIPFSLAGGQEDGKGSL